MKEHRDALKTTRNAQRPSRRRSASNGTFRQPSRLAMATHRATVSAARRNSYRKGAPLVNVIRMEIESESRNYTRKSIAPEIKN
jgi:hypothetical protein